MEAANQYYQDDAKRAAMSVKKMLKCGGCGELLADTAAFQEHCAEVFLDYYTVECVLPSSSVPVFMCVYRCMCTKVCACGRERARDVLPSVRVLMYL